MVSTDVIDALGHLLNIPSLSFNEDLLCLLSVNNDNVDVTIETNESGELLYVCAHLGTMPDDDNAAAAIALLFAQANAVLTAMNKGVLVLDYNGQGLMLVKLYEMKHWELEDCLESILQLFNDAGEWKNRLYLPDFGLGGMDFDLDTSSSGSDQFMRV